MFGWLLKVVNVGVIRRFGTFWFFLNFSLLSFFNRFLTNIDTMGSRSRSLQLGDGSLVGGLVDCWVGLKWGVLPCCGWGCWLGHCKVILGVMEVVLAVAYTYHCRWYAMATGLFLDSWLFSYRDCKVDGVVTLWWKGSWWWLVECPRICLVDVVVPDWVTSSPGCFQLHTDCLAPVSSLL